MAWSVENATRAYLHTLKSGNEPAEPDVAGFVSALAAGSGARLMVEARADPAGPTTLALIAAAQQTNGRVVCILSSPDDLQPSLESVGNVNANRNLVQLVVGDAFELISDEFKSADFVLVDCRLRDQERVFEAAEGNGGLVVGCNAFSCARNINKGVNGEDSRVDLLPIGGGLRVCRGERRRSERAKSRWVVRVDEFTGEEHVYRITPASPRGRKGIRV